MNNNNEEEEVDLNSTNTQEHLTRQLFQIEHSISGENSTFSVVAVWDSIKQVTDTLGYYREEIDQALKKGFVSSGYFWLWSNQWNRGVRPDISKQVRNKRIYAYKDDKKTFINRYKNAVIASKDLSISVSNIRLVCDNLKYNSSRQSHKDFFFSYKPLFEEDDILSDIIGLRELRNELRDKTTIDIQINEKKKQLDEIQKRIPDREINLEIFEKNNKQQYANSKNTPFI